jgi:tetratricopeptide (TPR) repeat protein
MKKQCLIIVLIALGAILIISLNGRGIVYAQTRTNQFHSYLQLGIEKSFNMEFQTGYDYLQKAVGLDPENPTGYAYLAMINLFDYEMSYDEKNRKKTQAAMLRYVEETLTKGEKKIDKNDNDSEAYLAMALAKVAKVNWAVHEKHYLTMVREAVNIWEYLEKAQAVNPQNHDISFLMGLFHYHIDHLPGLTRFLSSLIITPGDKQKGLQELESAAQKGDLLKQLAQAELSSDYLNFEKQPARALPIIRELKDKYPNNYNLPFALGNVLADLGQSEDAFQVAREIDKKIQAGLPPFVSQLRPRYHLLMGRILFGHGEYEKAVEQLQKVLKDSIPHNARIRALAFVRLGMIYDIRKERKKAEEYYSQALEVKDGEGYAQIDAKKYLKMPYVLQPKN